jgi:hypothetical protein
MFGSSSYAPPQACNVICFTDTTLIHVGLRQARASLPRAHQGFMLWKLTREQLDRFLLVAAAILTVVFAIVALDPDCCTFNLDDYPDLPPALDRRQ